MPRPSKYPLMTVTVSAPICELERTAAQATAAA